MGENRDLFKELGDIKGIFHAWMGTIKERNGKDLTGRRNQEEVTKNTQKNYTKQVLMANITMMVWSLTQSQISWRVKLSGPQEA